MLGEGDDDDDDDDDEVGLGFELPVMGAEDDEEILDLTGASDEEVVTVFKKLSDNDEVEVVKDDQGGIHLKDNETGAEYYIKESMEEEWNSMKEGEQCSECGSGTMYEDEEGKYCSECGAGDSKDEIVYEIELNEPSSEEDGFEINNWDDASRWLRDTPEGRHAGSRPIEDFEEGAYIEEDKLQRHSRTNGKQRYHGARLAARESRTTNKPVVRREPTKNTSFRIQNNERIQRVKNLKTKK